MMSSLIGYWTELFSVPMMLSTAITVVIFFPITCLLFGKRPMAVLRRPTGIAVTMSAWWYMTCVFSDIIFSQSHPGESYWARLLRLLLTELSGIVLIWFVASLFTRRSDKNAPVA